MSHSHFSTERTQYQGKSSMFSMCTCTSVHEWRHKLCAVRMHNANVRNHLKGAQAICLGAQGWGGGEEGCSELWKFRGGAWGAAPFSLLRFSMRHQYGPIPEILELAPMALISNLEDRGHFFKGGTKSRGTYLIFSKPWPGMIIFLIHHLCIKKKQYKLLILIKTWS